MKKRIFSLIFVLLIALTLVSCKKDPKPEDLTPEEKAINEVYNTLDNLITEPDTIKADLSLPKSFVNDVTGEWESSDKTLLDFEETDRNIKGIVKRPSFEEGNKKVTLSITLKLEVEDGDDLTKDWSKELTIIALDEIKGQFDSFNDAYQDVKDVKDPKALEGFRSDTFVISPVTLYGSTSGGYFIATEDGSVAYVHGTSGMPTEGKFYEVTGKVYNYFGYFQMDGVNYKEVEEEFELNVEYVDSSVEYINDITLYDEDRDGNTALENAFTPETLKLKNVKIAIDPEISSSQYNVVIVPYDLDLEDAERKEDGDKHFKDAVMVYYTSNEFDAIKALEGLEIEELDVIFEGYRDDKHVKYVTILGIDNVKLKEVSDEESVTIAKAALDIPTDLPEGGELNLVDEGTLETTVTWSYKDSDNDHNDLVNLETGVVETPEEGRVLVTIVATITKGDAEETKEFKLEIGAYELKTIEDALNADKGEKLKVKGIVTNMMANNTYGFQDENHSIAIFTFDKLNVGKEYTLIGEKDEYNGLPQLTNIEVEAEKSASMPEAFDITDLIGDEDELEKHIGKYIKVEDLEVTSTSSGENYIEVKSLVGEKEITLRVDTRVSDINTSKVEELDEGDVFTITTNLTWFKGPQLGFGSRSNVMLEGEEVSQELLATYDFTTLSGENGKALNDESLVTVLNTATDNDDLLVSAKDVDKVYQGQGEGNALPEDQQEKVIKFGTGSVNGTATLVFDEEVSKVELKVRGWWEDDTVLVNGEESDDLGEDFKTLTFEFSVPTKEVTLEFTPRGIIESIKIYG